MVLHVDAKSIHSLMMLDHFCAKSAAKNLLSEVENVIMAVAFFSASVINYQLVFMADVDRLFMGLSVTTLQSLCFKGS